MALINIRRDVSNPFYRYKMERIQCEIEGEGDDMKTVILNLSSIAQSLARPEIYIMKFFGFEFGVQINMNPTDNRWIINGAHEATKLQDLLDIFITKFVLCKECLNPETDLVINHDLNIIRYCKVCGQRTKVDPRLKISGFILKMNQRKQDEKNKADKKAACEAKENSNVEGKGSLVDTHSDNGLDKNSDMAESDNEDRRGGGKTVYD